MDYIIKTAEQNGIYIGMVCIWGGLVKAGLMNEKEAEAYGKFLAERYKDSPNIIWFIGGDIRGDVKTEVWETLARTIKSIDKNHLMTFHPSDAPAPSTGSMMPTGWTSTCSRADTVVMTRHVETATTRPEAAVAEDNWRYVEAALAKTPAKPVVDGDPATKRFRQGPA